MHTQTHSYFLKAHHLIFWSKFSFSDSDISANFWEFFLFVLTGHPTGWQAGDIVCTVKCMLGTHMHIIPRRRQRLQHFLSSFPPLLLYLNPCQRLFSSLFFTCYFFFSAVPNDWEPVCRAQRVPDTFVDFLPWRRMEGNNDLCWQKHRPVFC